MKDITLILCAVFCVMTIVLAAFPRAQAYTLRTTYTVEIREDGTASWVIEQSAYLETDADQANFEQLISRAMVYIDQFTSNVSTIIDQAHARTGRFMTAENITVGGNVTESGVGAYGFLQYSFDWTNFAPVENTNIAIGDGFSNESFIFGDGGLSILLPTGYSVKSCSPSPDYDSNGLLEWNSVSDLRVGQPTVLMSRAEGNSFFPAFPVLFYVLFTITAVALTSLLVLKLIKRKKESTLKTAPDEANEQMEDTERVLALLKKGGGRQLPQSKIVEQLDFSKAKASKILGEMESKGIIERRKSGREKVVSLKEET